MYRASYALIVGIALAAGAVDAQMPDRVAIHDGTLQGATTDGVTSFKGIPLAAPPVGALRWQPPQSPAPWTGVRQATAYAHDCMQKPVASDAAPLGTPPAEDCLYLNVWRPSGTATGAKLPVLVWIYGGGFVNGGSSPPTYSGAELAKRGIVFVSFNYRVARFGWFVHPQLTGQIPPGGVVGNYGFMDQVAALRWVRANIAAFGGDPANVTIVGESAGGASVHTLLTSPMTTELFARAVIQSGGDGKLLMNDVASASKAGVAFAASQGIAADDPDALAKLRALPAQTVTGDLNMSTLLGPSKGIGAPTYTLPIIDGRLAVDAPAAYRAGRFHHVPVIVGATSADLFGPDGPMMKGARQVADLLSAQGVPVHYYRFSYVASSARTGKGAGAGHASDIPFFFATTAAKFGDKTSAQDRRASATASGYLVNFVKTGDPNGAGLPAWPAYRTSGPTMLNLDTAGGATIEAVK